MVEEVSHPKHYTNSPSGIECIQITEHMNFCIGNAVKYCWRAGLKTTDPLKDLRKAAWYISREIERVEKAQQAEKEAAASEVPEFRPTLVDYFKDRKKHWENHNPFIEGWITHDGISYGALLKPCGTAVRVRRRDGSEDTTIYAALAGNWCWKWNDDDITHYQYVEGGFDLDALIFHRRVADGESCGAFFTDHPPLSNPTLIVALESGKFVTDKAASFQWTERGDENDIVAYQYAE